ncbi:isocitrate lyase/PEP mutase family protein [Calorimonas adulescens]|uniref:2-methylisocitrate lyase n=1 Tax=Calorimonas adulescens TaxID=2606906 RepID=A0A5D8Q9S6_9THEO|nr:isocitrate lyase/PEP mutase family protein [Calorimonas adulescens]TZE81515.1 isocitrate lyase/PEP mutase family protein [Calorimonas adulescens]
MGKGRIIKQYIERKKILVSPGAFNSISAKMVEQAGFPSVYLTGYGAAANLLGAPDIGLLSMSEMVKHLKYMNEAVNIPIIADADTGYGNALNVYRTVKEYEKAGAAAIQLEDQTWPKRCGHMEGKEVISAEEMVGKLKAALDARDDDDTLIIARTDALAPLGFDEAIRRANLYKETGADIIFVEAPPDIEQLKRIPREVNAPILANMIEGGKTPVLSSKQLEEMGFAIVIYPLSALYMMTKAVKDVLTELKEKDTTQGMVDKMISFKEFNEIVELSKIRENEKKYKL